MRFSFRSALRSIRQSWQGLAAGADLFGTLLVLTLRRAFGQPRDRLDFGADGEGALVPVPVRPRRPHSGQRP